MTSNNGIFFLSCVYVCVIMAVSKTLQHNQANSQTEMLSILNRASKWLSRGNFLLFIPDIAWTNIIIRVRGESHLQAAVAFC